MIIAGRLRLPSRRTSHPPIAAAVVFHRLAERSGDPRRELVPAISVRDFSAMVTALARRFRLVHARDLVAALHDRRDRVPVALTFDDDLRSHAELAAPVLRRLGVPASFFLGGGSLDGTPRLEWWAGLQAAVDSGLPLDDPLLGACAAQGGESIHDVADRVRRLDPARRREMTRFLWQRAGAEPERALSRGDIGALAQGGFEIGFHTRDHDSLDDLDEAALREALVSGRDALEHVSGSPVRTIAYPHGRAAEREARAAEAAGYAAGFTTAEGALVEGDDPLLIGRIEPFGARPRRLIHHLEHALAAAAQPGSR